MSPSLRAAPRAFAGTLAAAALLALVAPGCAPPPHPAAIEAGTLRARYLEALDRRERVARSIEAQVELRAELGGRQFPGALATLDIAAPDRCRLRVAEPGGTALDAVGAGARLWAWLPGSRSLEDLTTCADSAALADLPALVVRGAAALWRPVADSAAGDGEGAAAGAAARELRWREGDRSLRVSFSADGLPDTVTLARDRSMVRIVYGEWTKAGAAQLPREYVLSSSNGARIRCRVSRLHLRSAADSTKFAVPGPRGATPATDCELWRLLANGGEP